MQTDEENHDDRLELVKKAEKKCGAEKKVQNRRSNCLKAEFYLDNNQEACLAEH